MNWYNDTVRNTRTPIQLSSLTGEIDQVAERPESGSPNPRPTANRRSPPLVNRWIWEPLAVNFIGIFILRIGYHEQSRILSSMSFRFIRTSYSYKDSGPSQYKVSINRLRTKNIPRDERA